MIKFRRSAFALSAALMLPLSAGTTDVLCRGFLPENDLRIPVGLNQAGGITQDEFNQILDRVELHYKPVIAAKRATLKVNRLWTDSTVNASAERAGRSWVINMYGGLARHQAVTADAFALVACHEIGHHLGGAPKAAGFLGPSWATNEGEADYFATLRCLRLVFTEEENSRFVQQNQIDPSARQRCELNYTTQAEKNLCMREAMASFDAGKVMQALRQEEKPPHFDTPDTRVVSRTDDDHPAAQCRLDTYYQGSLCFHDTRVELSDTNPNIGTCTLANGQREGVRPRCWFAP